jgi:phage shock protein B
MKFRHGGFSARSREAQGEEAQLIQDIYKGLSRMEARVEALETILMEHGERSPKYHDKQAL